MSERRVSAYWKRREEAEAERRTTALHQEIEAQIDGYKSQQDAHYREYIAAIKRIGDQRDAEAHCAKTNEERHEAWERRRFCLEIGGIVVALIAAGILYGQQITMQGQLEEMRDEQRPWVYPVVQIKGRITKENGNLVIPLAWTLKNVGHLPAFDAVVLVDGLVRSIPFTTTEMPNPTCDKRRKADWDKRGNAGVIFPGDPTDPQAHSPRISQADYTKIQRGGDTPVIMAIGCVDYRIPGDRKHHQTRFGYIFGPTLGFEIGTFQGDPTSVDIGIMGGNQGRFGSAD